MMFLAKLKLTNYRCYKNIEFNFSPTLNIIVGQNASGKTSLVEAVSVLASTKSFRTSDDSQLVLKNSNYLKISGKFVCDDKENDVEYVLTKEGKLIKVNNNTIKILSLYIGMHKIVSFLPSDLEIIQGAPSNRRKFLDFCISQIDRSYLRCLIEYKRVLKIRNEILKTNKATNDIKLLLDSVNCSLIDYAKELIKKRMIFLNQINPFFQEYIKVISLGKEDMSINYLPCCGYEDIEKEISQSIFKDIELRTTTKGPHKDNFIILINGEDLSAYGSQGQQRTSIICLKLAYSRLLKEKEMGNIVILDDVFSELDQQRQRILINMIDKKTQVFITTTSINEIVDEVKNESLIIKITKEGEKHE